MRTVFFFFLYLACAICSEVHAQSMSFVEKGKSWHMKEYYAKSMVLCTWDEIPDAEYDLCFAEDCDTVIGNVEYMCLTYRNIVCKEPYYAQEGEVYSLLRENNGKVYLYSEKLGRDILLYDFTLSNGEEFELESQYGGKYSCKVEKVEYVEVNGRKLKSITFSSEFSEIDREEFEDATVLTQWTEYLGGAIPVCQPLENPGLIIGGNEEYVTWVSSSDGTILPLSVNAMLHGQPLILGEEVTERMPEDMVGHDDLHYEIEEDSLHVYGTIWTDLRTNLYVCYSNIIEADFSWRTDVYMKRTIQSMDGAEPSCLGAFLVDFYVALPLYCADDYYVYNIYDSEGVHEVNANVGPISIEQTLARPNGKSSQTYNLSGVRSETIYSNGIYIKNGKKYMK